MWHCITLRVFELPQNSHGHTELNLQATLSTAISVSSAFRMFVVLSLIHTEAFPAVFICFIPIITYAAEETLAEMF